MLPVAMSSPESSVGRFYDGWHIYNERIVEVVRDLSPEGLMVRPAPERWPIWATVGHTAGMRVYWLCGVFGEPGAERTPLGRRRRQLQRSTGRRLPHGLGRALAIGDDRKDLS